MGYFFQKLLTLFLSLFLITTVTFFLMHAIPGDPFIGDRPVPQEVLDSLHAYFGLDQPLWKQYLNYLKGLISGDLGPSIIYQGRHVNQFIKEGLPVSMLIGLSALLIAVPFGILLGTISAIKRGFFLDHLAMFISTLGVSIPSFVLASLMQYLFAIKLSILPVARFSGFSSIIMPSLALAALPTAYIARLTRSNMIEVLSQDYIQTALAKGISLFRVSIYHGLRNACLPIITYLGPLTAHILTGTFMIEKIFAIPGLGGWMIQSINSRDYPMIMGLTIFFSTSLMIAVFFVDLIYGVVDPKIKLGKNRILKEAVKNAG